MTKLAECGKGTAGPPGSTERALLLLSEGAGKGLPDETEGDWEGAGQVEGVCVPVGVCVQTG